MKSCRFLLVFFLIARVATVAQAQTPTGAYDTPEQTKAKIFTLATWSVVNSSKESPSNSRPEYALKVLEIIKRMPPHRITYEMYKNLEVEDQNGHYLADAWLTFGSLPKEVSRTSLSNNESVIYQWSNTDGSNVVGTFRNGHFVSKTQIGLQ